MRQNQRLHDCEPGVAVTHDSATDLEDTLMTATATQSTCLPCPYCHRTMHLVHRLALREMPEIAVFYCPRCKHVETVKQERAA